MCNFEHARTKTSAGARFAVHEAKTHLTHPSKGSLINEKRDWNENVWPRRQICSKEGTDEDKNYDAETVNGSSK
jgi:hypothetical protein